MKNQIRLLAAVALVLLGIGFSSCSKEEGPKIIRQKEYELTIGSEMIPGLLCSDGENQVADVYAAKENATAVWRPIGPIQDFEYKEGTEYRILLQETQYRDDRKAEPVWSEYQLIKVLGQEDKRSEDLPIHLFPDGFLEKNTTAPRCTWFTEVEDAATKAAIEKDLEDAGPIAHSQFLLYNHMTQWACILLKENFSLYGELQRKKSEQPKNPEHFLPLLQDWHPQSWQKWDLIEQHDPGESGDFIVFFVKNEAWLCHDKTFCYQKQYPSGGVKSVIDIFVLGRKQIF